MTLSANKRLDDGHDAVLPIASPPRPRRNHIGTVSLIVSVIGAVVCHVVPRYGVFADAEWLRILQAGFDASLVGGLADWFAVTALFRHPLGLPIPHTAIIPKRRAKIIEGIVTMVQDEWLSPQVIGARLERLAPSAILLEWLETPAHVERLGAPVRDVLQSLARLLTEPEVVEFLDRTLHRQLQELPLDASTGRWLARLAHSESANAGFETLARSFINLTQRPDTAERLQVWIDRSARQLQQDGKRLIPLILRRKVVQRKLVEAACDYASSELAAAVADREHRLRRFVFGSIERFATRLSESDPDALAQTEQLRAALIESLEAQPLIGDVLARLRAQLESDLTNPQSQLTALIDRQLRSGIRELLADRERSTSFDRWIRSTAQELLRRHHDQIGLTVRENLEALETDRLVTQIEDRVGGDLQFIRLNGALVGGLIGVLIHVLSRFVG